MLCIGAQDTGYHIQEQYSVCIDSAFTNHEHAIIIEGVSVWNTNVVRFREDNDCTANIVKATAWDERWTSEEHIGVSDFYANEMIVFTRRIIGDDELRLIAGHEAGHFLNLSHTDPIKYPAIMDSVVREDVEEDFKLYPEDVRQLCSRWKCR
jgi:hypothetical protein